MMRSESPDTNDEPFLAYSVANGFRRRGLGRHATVLEIPVSWM